MNSELILDIVDKLVERSKSICQKTYSDDEKGRSMAECDDAMKSTVLRCCNDLRTLAEPSKDE